MRSKRGGGNEKKKMRRLSADDANILPLDLAEIINQCTILNEKFVLKNNKLIKKHWKCRKKEYIT